MSKVGAASIKEFVWGLEREILDRLRRKPADKSICERQPRSLSFENGSWYGTNLPRGGSKDIDRKKFSQLQENKYSVYKLFMFMRFWLVYSIANVA